MHDTDSTGTPTEQETAAQCSQEHLTFLVVTAKTRDGEWCWVWFLWGYIQSWNINYVICNLIFIWVFYSFFLLLSYVICSWVVEINFVLILWCISWTETSHQMQIQKILWCWNTAVFGFTTLAYPPWTIRQFYRFLG